MRIIPKHNLFITYTGKQFDLTNIKIEDICLEDIAHHLTKICRYGGAMELGQHYSVAQHSVVLAEYAARVYQDSELTRHLLMHDATEAYLGDIVKGLKGLLPDYLELESNLDVLIKVKYGLVVADDRLSSLVKELDTRILLDESREFVPHHYDLFQETLNGYIPLGVHVSSENYVGLEITKHRFLNMCHLLDIKD